MTRTVLISPVRARATVAARCCPVMLPVCLDAVVANLSTEQRNEVAATVTADLAAAAAHGR